MATKQPGAAIWIAALDTRHFSFEAYGATKADALRTLRAGWEQHRRDYPDAVAWGRELSDSVSTSKVQIGECWRDRDRCLHSKEIA